MENLNQQYTHILEYQLQREDYWIKPLYIAYTYGLNKKKIGMKIYLQENFSHH